MKRHPFEQQTPTPSMLNRLDQMRLSFAATYDAIVAHVPASAERTIAIRSLEEASMWANKAIAFEGERYLDAPAPSAPRT